MTLPEPFSSYTSKLFGKELWQRYLSSFDEPTPVSIRLNSGTDIEHLSHLPIDSPIPWSERGFYLTERPQFTLDPLLHAGAYYVQEASSQYLDKVLRNIRTFEHSNIRTLKPPSTQEAAPKKSFWLDLCAAPGGKSLILKDYLPTGTTLISNEYIRKRAWILTENIAKSQGIAQSPNTSESRHHALGTSIAGDIRVTNNSPEEIADSGLSFDLILCDVPCSGEGMFRKDRATIDEWSEENVQNCAALQKEIVRNAWQCLNPGGVLIYSTCTFNEFEDELNARFIQENLGGEPVIPARKFIPGQDRGEGQFMAAFCKPAGSGFSVPDGSVSGSFPKKDKKAEKRLQKALSRLNFMELPQDHKGTIDTPECEISLEQAQNFLRGQSIILPQETPHGLVAVTYKGFRLGQVKNIGSRANNLYPTEWRIKHL